MEGTEPKRLEIIDLIKPRSKLLTVGCIAVIGEGVANLLEPWPLKIVLDNVLKSRPTQGRLNQLILSWTGQNSLRIVEFAALAVLAIAAVGAICSYVEKYVTTSIGQW